MAYGILVQLALEERNDELQRLDTALTTLGLPRKLADLGVALANEGEVDAFIAHTLRANESIHYLPGVVDAPRLWHALRRVEELGAPSASPTNEPSDTLEFA